MKTMKTTDSKTEAALSPEGAAHHPFGPSRWPALIECPCWEGKPATENTERGTDLHLLFERAMNGEEVEVTDSLEWHVVEAARKIRRCAVPDKRGFLTEKTVRIPGAGVMFGRLDLAWVDAVTGDVHVADLKLAYNPDRDYTAQVLAYANGVLAEMRNREEPKPRVWLHMLYADGSETSQRMLAAEDAIKQHMDNACRILDIMDGNVDMRPCQCGWCDLCAKFTTCPAMKAVVDKASPKLEEAAKPEVWATFPSERKAQLCALADTLQKWCATVREQAAADAKAGVSIEDPPNGIFFGLQERKGRLLIEDARQAWEVVEPYLSAASYRACLSVNQAELKAALKQAGVKLSDINALVERCGTRLPSTTVFVRKGLKEPA